MINLTWKSAVALLMDLQLFPTISEIKETGKQQIKPDAFWA